MTDIYSYDKKQNEQVMIHTDNGKRHKEQFIQDLKEGDAVNDMFSVKVKTAPRAYKRGTMFDLVAIDKTGEMAVKYWGGDNKDRVKRLFSSFQTGDVIQIRKGNVELYNEKLQISVNEATGGVRRCSDDEYEKSDFISALDTLQIERLYDELTTFIEEIDHKELRLLLDEFFNDEEFVYKYKHSPSAITHHHNYVGGNLQHCVGVARLCKSISEMYPGLNKDLLITGAILHDVGKLREYKTTTAIEKTSIGNFIGHIVIGDRWIREMVAGIRKKKHEFNEELETYICHMILSHHGKFEYGSPSVPKIAEALVLFQADFMDSQVKNYLQNLDDQRKNSDDDWSFVWDGDLGMKKAIFMKNIDQEIK
jgi:3'-5' exoribonuclease